MKNQNVFAGYPVGTELIVDKTSAEKRRCDFYVSLGIFPGSSVALFMRGKTGAIILAGKTKLALAGKAANEITVHKMQ